MITDNVRCVSFPQPGVYKDATVVDELTKQPVTHKQWSCCGRHHEFAAGCSTRPHVCKEVMVHIKVETNPPTRVENIEVSVIKYFELSIFPGATYDLHMQFTKNLSTVLHNYFAVEALDLDALNKNADESTALSTRLDGASTMSPSEALEEHPAELKKKKSIFHKLMGGVHKRRNSVDSHELVSSPHSSHSGHAHGEHSAKPVRRLSQKEHSTRGSIGGDKDLAPGGSVSAKQRAINLKHSISQKAAGFSERHHLHWGHGHEGAVAKVPAKKKMQEGLYIQYFRVGVINVDVSTSGFAINLDKFKAVMEEYVCRKELLDWKKLIYLLEKHLVVSLFKHSAGNSLAKLGNLFRLSKTPDAAAGAHHRRSTVSGAIQYVDPEEDPADVKAMKRALILGNPLSPSNAALARMRKSQLHHGEMLILPQGALHHSKHEAGEERAVKEDGKQRDSFVTHNTSTPEKARSNSAASPMNSTAGTPKSPKFGGFFKMK